MSLQVVLLKKTTLLDKSQFEKPLKLGGRMLRPWVVMGHFDAMYVYQLDTKNRNIFTAIHENNSDVVAMNDENTYYHPLYLLTQQDDTDFWKQDNWFIAVTRIHLASTVTEPDEIEELSKYILNRSNVAGCSCVVYQTIELSDLIMIVKSQRISNMLDVVLNLWSHPGIGKLYTYCGIDYEYLKNLDIQPEENDIIDFLSMRFAVRNPSNADMFFKIVQDKLGYGPIFSIAGVDDAVLNYNSMPVQKLIGFFRLWFVTGLSHNFDIKLVFSDVTTRLGTKYQKCKPSEEEDILNCSNEPNPSIDKFQLLNQHCYELVDLCKEVQMLSKGKLESPIDKYWLRSFSELSYSLLRLCRTALLDEFVYLMFPGVYSFQCNMKAVLDSGNYNNLDREALCLFVNNWSQLMEHVMRLEGQLAHQPETRPILYDIPLAMLEYTMALLDLCSNILQKKDEPKKDIQLILFPKVCSVIETEEMFAANHRLPGLLSISIPLHMLYDPRTIQITLCHEISHFVGEKHRNRTLRRECYIHAAAILIADLIFENEDEIFITEIYRRLKKYIFSDKILETIFDVEEAIQKWIDKLLYDDPAAKYCDLIRNVLINTQFNTEYKQLKFSADFASYQDRNQRYFEVILPKLTMLFREVFADICMVSLLNLDSNTYLDSLYKDVIGNPGTVEFTAVRIFTTLSAVKKDIPEQRDGYDGEVSDLFFGTLQGLILNQPNRDNATYQFPIGIVKQLQIYSDKCASDIKALLEDDDETSRMVSTLQTMYHNVISTNIDYNLLQGFINDYRKKSLGGID